MSKVVVFIATSLDGYIASSDGTVDWLFHDADYGYTEFMVSLDAVVMGRKTWEQAKTFEEVPFAAKQVFVFFSTLPSPSDEWSSASARVRNSQNTRRRNRRCCSS